nr:PREDICTED: longitudinals lacking protein, isoforms A/B/D/L-like [Bemisia tabaci]
MSASASGSRRSRDVRGTYTCNLCFKKTYSWRSNLIRHQKFECPNNIEKPVFPCMLCDHTTKQKAHLERHLQLVHKLLPDDIPKNLLSRTSFL